MLVVHHPLEAFGLSVKTVVTILVELISEGGELLKSLHLWNISMVRSRGSDRQGKGRLLAPAPVPTGAISSATTDHSVPRLFATGLHSARLSLHPGCIHLENSKVERRTGAMKLLPDRPAGRQWAERSSSGNDTSQRSIMA